MIKSDENKSIEVQRASNPVGAFINARENNLKASEMAVFQKENHLIKVEKVQEIVKNFFIGLFKVIKNTNEIIINRNDFY